MTIKELKVLGFSDYQLRQFANDPKAPVVRTTKRGQIKFDTTRLDEYLENQKNKKSVSSNVPWSERKKRLFAN